MDKAKADELLIALISAYVWVASADRDVDSTEHIKFSHVIVESPFATQFEATHVQRYFKDMVTLFADDFEAAVGVTRQRLEKFRGPNAMAEEVIRFGRAALVGDARLAEAEEMALVTIGQVLGVAP